jgi:hypothetical protein
MIIAAFHTAEDAFKPIYREWRTEFIKNKLVTDSDLVAMGFGPRYIIEPHPSPVPVTYPNVEVVRTVQCVFKLIFFNPDTNRRAKPFGVHGVEIVWSILPTAPVSVAELRKSDFSTKSYFVLSFDFSLIGQTAYAALRYENKVGEKGPWSPIFSFYIS